MTKEVPRTSVLRDEELIARLQNSKGWPTLGNAAADRIEELISERDDAEAKLAENEVRLGKAVEALEWYADKCNYETFHEDLPCDCCTDIYEPVMRDEGETALATLAEIKSGVATTP